MMIVQTNFVDTKPPTGSEIVKHLCCSSCYNALKDRCECRCGGAYHGMGTGKNPTPEDKAKVKVKLLKNTAASFLSAQVGHLIAKDMAHVIDQCNLLGRDV